MRQAVLDILALLGLAALLHGVWQVYQPAAWMLGGALLLAVALILSRVPRVP